MARLRPGKCTRKVKRPYTRKSKYRKKSYAKTPPGHKIVKFEIGNTKRKFSHAIHLISKNKVQIRHNALEAARIVANRHMNNTVKKENFHLIIRVYPHNIMREHKLLAGAGCDRFQSGMKKAFGKAVGVAAHVKEGQEVMTIKTDKQNVEHARDALKKAASKLPCSCRMRVVEQ